MTEVCLVLVVIYTVGSYLLIRKHSKNMMKVFTLVKYAYATILRELVVNAIDNPDSTVDDFVLSMLDRIFDYNE